jgi:uncharacterized protein (DUF779 family)
MSEPDPRLPRVVATEAARAAIRRLVADRGPVMFIQSGGCCDGSLPMCFSLGEFIVGPGDELLGEVEGCPFYMDRRQYDTVKHCQLILDVGDGEPEGFSLEAGEGRHFITRSIVCAPAQAR